MRFDCYKIEDLKEVEKPIRIVSFFNNKEEYFGKQSSIPEYLKKMSVKILSEYPDRIEIYIA